jgi:hypothetical protein
VHLVRRDPILLRKHPKSVQQLVQIFGPSLDRRPQAREFGFDTRRRHPFEQAEIDERDAAVGA